MDNGSFLLPSPKSRVKVIFICHYSKRPLNQLMIANTLKRRSGSSLVDQFDKFKELFYC